MTLACSVSSFPHSKMTFFPAQDKENNWKQVVEADAGHYSKRTASFSFSELPVRVLKGGENGQNNPGKFRVSGAKYSASGSILRA